MSRRSYPESVSQGQPAKEGLHLSDTHSLQNQRTPQIPREVKQSSVAESFACGVVAGIVACIAYVVLALLLQRL
jgi:uncharacterized membrane protein YoaK (UPF0700 family)